MMDETSFPQPTHEQLTGFVDGDPIAIDECIRIVLDSLYRWAFAHYPALPRDEVQSMLHQVVAEVCRNHARYDPQRAKLTTYIIHILKLRLNDLYQAERNRANAEESGDAASEKLLRLPYNTSDAATRLARRDFFDRAMQQLDPLERAVLAQMRRGEKDHDVYRAILERYGSVHDPVREVKNVKERVQRKVRAFARQQGFRLDDLIE